MLYLWKPSLDILLEEHFVSLVIYFPHQNLDFIIHIDCCPLVGKHQERLSGQNRFQTSCKMSVLTHWIERKWPSFSRPHFQMHFLVSKLWIPNKIPMKFVAKGPINNVPALVQIISWHRPGNKPLSEPMMVICVTRPRWVNTECILNHPLNGNIVLNI